MKPHPAAAATVIISVLIALFMIEGAARLLDFASPPQAHSWTEFRLNRPPPYRNATFDVDKLISETLQIKWNSARDYGWLPRDRAGKYINIRDGMRGTEGVPPSGRHVWIFGGSAVFGVEGPDDSTIASLIQALANKDHRQARIANIGATTITIQHELYRLLHMTPIASGDIVIFYDGVNDIIQSLYYQNPRGNMIEQNRAVVASYSTPQRVAAAMVETIGSRSAFVRRFLTIPPAQHKIEIPPSLLEQTEDDYYHAIVAADEFSRAKGATFFHFLQPSLYSTSKLTEYEKSILANEWLFPSALREAYAAGLPVLRNASQRAHDRSIAAFDLTSALDERNQEIFLDFCHITRRGNELIAKAIYAEIAEDL